MISIAGALIGVGVGFLLGEVVAYRNRQPVRLSGGDYDLLLKAANSKSDPAHRPGADKEGRALQKEVQKLSQDLADLKQILEGQKGMLGRALDQLSALPKEVTEDPKMMAIRSMLLVAESESTHRRVLRELERLPGSGSARPIEAQNPRGNGVRPL